MEELKQLMKINVKYHVSLVLAGLAIALFIFDVLNGKNKVGIKPLFFILILSLVSILFIYIFWLVYNLAIKNSAKLSKKDALTFLPFIFLIMTPIRHLFSFPPQHALYASKIPYFILLLPLSIFIFLKVLFFKKSFDNIKIKKIVFILIPVLYFLIFSSLAILKHESFFSTGYDLAVYDQVMWHYSNGSLGPVSTWLGNMILAAHVQPILFILVPIYKIFPSPITLLIIQTLFISIGAVPLYLLSKKKVKNEIAMLGIFAVYFLYPSIQFANLFDFHPMVLALPLVFFSFYFLEQKRYKLFLMSIILVGLCKEYLTLLLVTFGIYIFFAHKKRRFGTILAVLGLSWFCINILLVIPHFYNGPYYAFALNPNFGNTFGEAIKTLILNPFFVIKYLATVDKLAFLILLSIPVGFGVFAALGLDILFLGLTEFAIILLYNPSSLSDIVYHHQTIAVGFLVLATIVGLSRVSKLVGNKKNVLPAIGITLISLAVLSNFAYGPFSILYDLNDFNPYSEYVKNGKEIISMIPKNASVMAPNWILPHLNHRELAFLFPRYFQYIDKFQQVYGKELPKYVVFDLSRAILDTKRSSKHITKDNTDELINKKEYGVLIVKDSWFLLKKGLDHEENICKIKPFLDKEKYPYLNITIEDKALIEKC